MVEITETVAAAILGVVLVAAWLYPRLAEIYRLKTKVLAAVYCEDGVGRDVWVKPAPTLSLKGTPGTKKEPTAYEWDERAIVPRYIRILGWNFSYRSIDYEEGIPGPYIHRELLPFEPQLPQEPAYGRRIPVEDGQVRRRPYFLDSRLLGRLLHIHVAGDLYARGANLWFWALVIVALSFGMVLVLFFQELQNLQRQLEAARDVIPWP